jgi:hypothetical protein
MTMKNFVYGISVMLIAASCGSVLKFPVSDIIPAATITANIKQDKNENYAISVAANDLAAPERLNPPKKVYVVWILTKDNISKNIGQLRNKNAKKASLETISSFEPKDIFITAEEAGDVSYPEGIEISRVSADL